VVILQQAPLTYKSFHAKLNVFFHSGHSNIFIIVDTLPIHIHIQYYKAKQQNHEKKTEKE